MGQEESKLNSEEESRRKRSPLVVAACGAFLVVFGMVSADIGSYFAQPVSARVFIEDGAPKHVVVGTRTGREVNLSNFGPRNDYGGGQFEMNFYRRSWEPEPEE